MTIPVPRGCLHHLGPDQLHAIGGAAYDGTLINDELLRIHGRRSARLGRTYGLRSVPEHVAHQQHIGIRIEALVPKPIAG